MDNLGCFAVFAFCLLNIIVSGFVILWDFYVFLHLHVFLVFSFLFFLTSFSLLPFFVLFCLFLFDACFLVRTRKDTGLCGLRSGEGHWFGWGKSEKNREGQIVIRIYCMKKKLFSIKKQN